jgi:hypothetical protein
MNLIEAIKSGRRFRRKIWSSRWEELSGEDSQFLNLPVQAILADDWEVEPAYVTITGDQFDAAIEEVNKKVYCPPRSSPHISEYIDFLKKELGL